MTLFRSGNKNKELFKLRSIGSEGTNITNIKA